jgi:hypothetical protein
LDSLWKILRKMWNLTAGNAHDTTKQRQLNYLT